VDGVKARNLDLFASTQATAVIRAPLVITSGPHTIELRVLGAKQPASTGKRVDLDAIV
jgi:hypothetical protein